MQNPTLSLPPPLFISTTTTTTTTTTKDTDHHRTTTTTTTTANSISILLTTIFLSLLLFLLFLSISHQSLPPVPPNFSDPFLFPTRQPTTTTNNHYHRLLFLHLPTATSSEPPPPPPSLAYFISGSTNDSRRIIRLLLAVYHPRNHYLLHLDSSAPQKDRDFLARTVQSIPVFKAAQNVNVIGKPDLVYPKGSSSISSTLRGAAILLRISGHWDWFINLSAADYPLVTQDDLLHILSYLPKDLNFVNHTSYIGWRESRRFRPVIVDPGLFLAEKSEVFYGTQKRELPDAYRLFTGSPSAILTRKFMEFCILGTENLPRTLLMYLSNMVSSQPVYFPTVLCNSPQLNRTIINHSLQYSSFDTRMEPRLLGSDDFNDLIQSGAAFASPFARDDIVLDRIDQEILNRGPDEPVPGGWCLGESKNDTCTTWGDADVLRPGRGAVRLEKRIVELLSNGTFQSSQCIVE